MNKQTGAQTKEKRKGKINVQMHRKETRNKQTKNATNTIPVFSVQIMFS